MAISAPELLNADHDIAGFDCGKPSLNAWLQNHALTNQVKGFTVVIVVHDDGRVVGFYGLAPTAVEPLLAPRNVRTGRSPNLLPCLLLGQLGIDLAYQGQGLGTALAAHALARAVMGARLTGGRALLVNAVDDEAQAAWRRRGFLPSSSDPYRLFRSMQDIEASLRAAREGTGP